MQDQLNSVIEWSEDQEMVLNSEKCKEMILLHEYRDLFIDKAVRNNRSKLAIANRHQER